MSIIVSSRVWTLDLPRRERDVLVRLADYCDNEGHGARPSVRRLAWELAVSEREIQRSLKWLRAPERRIIEITRKAGIHRPNVYSLHLDRVPSKPPFEAKGDRMSYHELEWGDTATSPRQQERGDSAPTRGDILAEWGDKNGFRGDIATSSDPLLDPLSNPLSDPLLGHPGNGKSELTIEAPESRPLDPEYLEAERCALEALNVSDLNGNRSKLMELWQRIPRIELYRRVSEIMTLRRGGTREHATFREFEISIQRFEHEAQVNARSKA